jgi:uncharacterized RDD family membrane protein YckC
MSQSEFGLQSEEQDALRSTAAAGATSHVELAGWWIRVAAYLIDTLILFVGLFVLLVVGAAINDALLVVLIILWVLATLIGYWTYFEGGESGQTPGKRAMGIRVRNEAGGPAGYGRAFGRNLVARVIGFFPLVGLVDVLWPLWDSRKQCLHDKAGSTIVVRA